MINLSLDCSWSCKELATTERLNWTETVSLKNSLDSSLKNLV